MRPLAGNATWLDCPGCAQKVSEAVDTLLGLHMLLPIPWFVLYFGLFTFIFSAQYNQEASVSLSPPAWIS